MKKTILFLLLMLFALFAQDPQDIEWKEINTTHYRIIFPEEIYTDANRVANRMEYQYSQVGFYLNNYHRKIPLILSNRSVIPNGYVGLAPRRTEWYSLPWPGQSLSVGDWYNLLSIHEGRHLFQYSFGNQGMLRLGKFFFGQFGQMLALHWAFPEWFMEGDAVVTETLLSNSGRGRSATFQQNYRTMTMNDQRYTYEKIRFGSYKDHIPDHYETGYFMTTFIGRYYGYETWSNILEKAVWLSFLHPISPINGGLHKYTNYNNSEKLYHAMYRDLAEFWQKDFICTDYSEVKTLNLGNDKYYTDYLQCYVNNKNELMYAKVGLADQLTIYKNRLKIAEIPAVAKEYGFDIGDNKIVWSQYSQDKRWNKESWADIVVYDINLKKMKKITKKCHYLNPSLSPTGKYIAVVEFTSKRKCSLVILDADKGSIVQKTPAPNNEMINYPTWYEDEEKIVFTATGFNGRAIYELNVNSKGIHQISDYTYEDLFRPIYWRDYILYESNHTGINNIFAINRNTGKRYQVSSVKFGAIEAFVENSDLYFSNYSQEGYKITKISLREESFIPLKDVPKIKNDYFTPLLSDGFKPINEVDIPQEPYKYLNYSGIKKYFNYHSWLLTGDENQIGLQFFSENILGDLSHNLFLLQNYNHAGLDFGVNFNYLKLFPKIQLSLSKNNRREFREIYGCLDPFADLKEEWKEINFSMVTDWPIYRSDLGAKTQTINLQAGLGYKKIYDKISDVNTHLNDKRYNEQDKYNYPLHLSLHALSIEEKSKQALVPNYGQILLIYNRTIGEPFFEGIQKVISFESGLNLGNNTGAILQFQKEENIDNGYEFDNYIQQYAMIDDIHSIDRMRVKTTLRRHLAYPDFDLFWFLYIKRLVVNVSLDLLMMDEFQNNGYYYSIQSYNPITGIGLTTVLGGIFDFPIHLPITVTYYYNNTESYSGFGIRLF